MINLQGVNNLTSIGNTLYIFQCYKLQNLVGLESLTNLNHTSLHVTYCDNLTSLNGIQNIDYTTISAVEIILNHSLTMCAVQSVCNYLANNNSNTDIQVNNLGCNNRDEVTAMCINLSIDENYNFSTFILYPNPTLEKVNINVQSNCKINVYNATGQKLKEINLSSGLNEINLDFLSSGTYFFKIENGNTLKVIKQ